MLASAVAQKVAKVAKSGTPDGSMALKPLSIDYRFLGINNIGIEY